ncbi:MAG TPA: ATP-binding cassette domain-containing protein [Myxococcaceae bacterium]|nr:ATP-binding cassette domain-containing protein [Myxococcaceae bacterium]
MTPLVLLDGVSRAYGGAAAVHPLTLAVARGRTTVLVGPSGSGKSTLLRMMVGLVRPDTGRVLFEGRPLTQASAPAERLRMGLVLQGGGLFPHLTVEGNATLVARHLGWPEPRIRARLDALLARVQLPRDVLGRIPAELSGGQRQRVSLVRALMLEPVLLLLDEALGALDPIIRSELQDDLKAAFKSMETTVVLVTHDLAEAAYLGDTLVLLRDGRIVQEGTAADLVNHPADPFVEHFVRAQRALPGGAAR